MIEFEIRPSSSPRPDAERAEVLRAPGFGQVFTDHMITLRWTAERGWHDGRLEPYGPFTLDPATSVFHYSQEFFEGLKAYRQLNGSISMFRPDANATRFNASARRMAMPELPEETFIRALELLVAQDREWVPAGEGNSLYLRPFMIATQRGLGVNYPSNEYLFCVIASPAASYFAGGVKPVTVWLSEDFTRAAPGGTGGVKTGGNYAAAFVAQQQANEQGCDQVVWLDATEHRWVEEMGGMNLFFVFGGDGGPDGRRTGDQPVIMTPPLTGTLLPGITRDSLLRLAPELGVTVIEDKISTDQWQAQCAEGSLTEVFACGTAAIVMPIAALADSDQEMYRPSQTNVVAQRLRDALLAIQERRAPDPFGWVQVLE